MKQLRTLRLKLVGNIALAVAAIAGTTLLLTMAYLSQTDGTDYASIIESHTLSESQLLPAMLIAGFTTVITAAVLTWLITLYGTFRIAGPLFRFARNVEQAATEGPARMIPIRKTDCLQEEWQHLKLCADALESQRMSLLSAVKEAKSLLADPATTEGALREAVARIRKITARARF